MTADYDDFVEKTVAIRTWLRGGAVSTDRLVDELNFWAEHWAEHQNTPTPAEGQIWGRPTGTGLNREIQHVRVEAYVPETSLGPLVVWTFCGVTANLGSPMCEHVEMFLRRSTFQFMHGHGPTAEMRSCT